MLSCRPGLGSRDVGQRTGASDGVCCSSAACKLRWISRCEPTNISTPRCKLGRAGPRSQPEAPAGRRERSQGSPSRMTKTRTLVRCATAVASGIGSVKACLPSPIPLASQILAHAVGARFETKRLLAEPQFDRQPVARTPVAKPTRARRSPSRLPHSRSRRTRSGLGVPARAASITQPRSSSGGSPTLSSCILCGIPFSSRNRRIAR